MPSLRSRCGGGLRGRGGGDIREQSFRAICDAAEDAFAVEPAKPITLLMPAGGLRQAPRADAIFMLVEYETEYQLRFGRKIKKLPGVGRPKVTVKVMTVKVTVYASPISHRYCGKCPSEVRSGAVTEVQDSFGHIATWFVQRRGERKPCPDPGIWRQARKTPDRLAQG
jgi:hypothetical protein